MAKLKATVGLGVALAVLGACDVDPLDPAVQNPSHQAAFSAGAGVVPRVGAVSQSRNVSINLTDSGYVGSGAFTDMNNFRPLTFTLCPGEACSAQGGAGGYMANCNVGGSGITTCTEEDASGAMIGRFQFYPDQRYAAQLTENGRFISGVWHQTPSQRQSAEELYAAMMTTFENRFGREFERESEARYAPIAALEAIGDASLAGSAPIATASPGAAGSSVSVPSFAGGVTSLAARQTRNVGGYLEGNHDIEMQSRRRARAYTCQSAQSIPQAEGGACTGFRGLVIIEACRNESVVPPAAYNQDQPQFFQVAESFANEGSNFGPMCGI